MDAQELDVADQVSDAELEFDVLVQTHELVIRREVIAANRAVELGSQRFDQNLAATAGRDFEDSKRTTKDANVVFGMFDPSRHMKEDEKVFAGYDSCFRILHGSDHDLEAHDINLLNLINNLIGVLLTSLI